MAKLMLFSAVVATLCTMSWAYSAGAPTSVCDDMTPKHPVDPQKSKSPYTVTLSKSQVKPGETVEITLSGKPYKGYLIQVRNGAKAVGSFDISAEDKFSKAISCHGGKNNAATHKNATDKKDLPLKWKAPGTKGEYTVYITGALDGGTFWVRQPTQKIQVN